MRNTGVPNTYDKPESLLCPVYSTDTRDHFSWEEPVHKLCYLVLVNLVGVKWERTRTYKTGIP